MWIKLNAFALAGGVVGDSSGRSVGVASRSAPPVRGDTGQVPGVAGVGIVVDVCLCRGCGADEQPRRACIAWCGVVAEG